MRLHPEAVAGDPATVQWVVEAGVLPFAGAVAAAPGALGALLAEGVLARVCLESRAVRATLAPGWDWSGDGARVREALLAALVEPAGWVPVEAAALAPGALLRACVAEVIAGDVGDYVRSHGGTIGLISAQDDVVELALGGVCATCPARGQTLDDRIEVALRERYPRLRAVRRAEAAPAARRRPVFATLRRRA